VRKFESGCFRFYVFKLKMSTLSSPDDLKELKRSDLQKLAKQHGIKANLKVTSCQIVCCEMIDMFVYFLTVSCHNTVNL
jgi:hypothetical protein